MPNHLKKLQQLISKSEQDQLESLIVGIERRYPVEVVVALTDEPAVVPFASARMIALLAVAAELVAEFFWLPVPAWVMGLFVFLFLTAPVGRLQKFWLFRLISSNRERETAVSNQASLCFNDLGLARTKERNALLLFFNVREKIFYLHPDRTLEKEWPELKIEDLSEKLKTSLQNTGAPQAAAAEALSSLLSLARVRWPDSAEKTVMTDELPNALAWWTPR
ncbi:MAG: hypothetical protein EBR09_08650 [Proteobacteria bacterium]|nr:hypothetical protein [Pseudomonadota bacterium]